MSDLAVVMACDAGFLPYSSYLAAMLDQGEPGRDFDLVIFGSDLPPLPPALGDIRLHSFDGENPFTHTILAKRRSHASYLRLLLPETLPEYHRILYLDSDIVPTGPISDVFGADLHGQALGAVRDAQQWRTPRRVPAEFSRLGLPALRYLNSGVMLFDTERWRAEGWTGACVDVARNPQMANAYVRNDQSAINLALRGQWTELSPVWNWQWTESTRYFGDDAGARLMHFIGQRKPWRTTSLPPRYSSGYRSFLERHFPDAPMPPTPSPRVDRHRRALLRHWFRMPAMQAFLDRFPDPLTAYPPDTTR